MTQVATKALRINIILSLIDFHVWSDQQALSMIIPPKVNQSVNYLLTNNAIRGTSYFQGPEETKMTGNAMQNLETQSFIASQKREKLFLNCICICMCKCWRFPSFTNDMWRKLLMSFLIRWQSIILLGKMHNGLSCTP